MTETSGVSVGNDQQLGRRNLMDVLMFLERRGASPAAMALAMEREGIHPDVAKLISRCTPETPVPVESLQPVTSIEDRTGIAATRALSAIGQSAFIWVVLLGFGLTMGFYIGYEIGISQGFDAGLDRLASYLQNS